jgi:hypothetical protein
MPAVMRDRLREGGALLIREGRELPFVEPRSVEQQDLFDHALEFAVVGQTVEERADYILRVRSLGHDLLHAILRGTTGPAVRLARNEGEHRAGSTGFRSAAFLISVYTCLRERTQ